MRLAVTRHRHWQYAVAVGGVYFGLRFTRTPGMGDIDENPGRIREAHLSLFLGRLHFDVSWIVHERNPKSYVPADQRRSA